jgi:hypothetical protein
MKAILILLLLSACSTKPTSKSQAELKKGDDFFTIREARDNPPEKVTSFKQGSYFLWDGKILAFKDQKYQHTVETPAEADKYKLAMETYRGKEAPEKTIFLKQWNKERDTTDWSRLSRLLSDILTEEGFRVVEKPEEAQQTLRVSYGVLPMDGGNYRYLNLNSIDSRAFLQNKSVNSYWKAKISSWGTGKDVGKLFPFFIFAMTDAIKTPETKVSNPVVDEGSFDFIVFKDYFGIK